MAALLMVCGVVAAFVGGGILAFTSGTELVLTDTTFPGVTRADGLNVQETEAFLAFVVAAIFFVGAAIVSALQSAGDRLADAVRRAEPAEATPARNPTLTEALRATEPSSPGACPTCSYVNAPKTAKCASCGQVLT